MLQIQFTFRRIFFFHEIVIEFICPVCAAKNEIHFIFLHTNVLSEISLLVRHVLLLR